MSHEAQSEREVDVRIANEIMGWEQARVSGVGTLMERATGIPPHVRGWVEVPYYSRDISAAWDVLEALVERGARHPMIRYDSDRTSGPRWTAAFGDVRGDASTPALAICRAAIAWAAPVEPQTESPE